MASKVVKATSKGQITIPQKWRSKFNTENYLLKMHETMITVTPIDLNTLESEEIIFDADRDNRGRGIAPAEMIKMLKKIRNE